MGLLLSADKEIKAVVRIVNAKGLHARAAAELSRVAEAAQADLVVTKKSTGMVVDGKSILDLMMLAAAKGTELELKASGKDARKLIKHVVKLVEAGFNEED